MRKTYWAVRFKDDNIRDYRVTHKKYASADEGAKECYGMMMGSSRMKCVSFSRKWINLTVAEKLAVEKELGL